MQIGIADIWQHMGIPAMLVALTLLVMGLASLTVFIERLITLSDLQDVRSESVAVRFDQPLESLRRPFRAGPRGPAAGAGREQVGMPRTPTTCEFVPDLGIVRAGRRPIGGVAAHAAPLSSRLFGVSPSFVTEHAPNTGKVPGLRGVSCYRRVGVWPG